MMNAHFCLPFPSADFYVASLVQPRDVFSALPQRHHNAKKRQDVSGFSIHHARLKSLVQFVARNVMSRDRSMTWSSSFIIISSKNITCFLQFFHFQVSFVLHLVFSFGTNFACVHSESNCYKIEWPLALDYHLGRASGNFLTALTRCSCSSVRSFFIS